MNIPNFTPTKLRSNEDKQKVAKQFIAFYESGFAAKKLTKFLYLALSNMFFDIAHYDIAGWYDYWFSGRNEDYIKYILRYEPIGNPAYTLSDVEAFIKEYIKQNPK